MPLNRFRATAFLGYSLIILPLGAGLAFGIGHLNAIGGDAIDAVAEQSNSATLAEHLRWNAASAVSAARGYVITAEPSFLREFERATASFDRDLQELRGRTVTAEGKKRLTRVEQASERYRRALQQAFARRAEGLTAEQITDQMEAEVVPLKTDLENSLDALASFRKWRANDTLQRAEDSRARWMLGARLMTVALVVIAVALAWYFSKLLSRAHRVEQDALARARKAVRLRDDLVGIVAHDLRNPLAAIALKAASLRKGAQSDKTRRQAESIENITQRMELLIRSMLDLATMEAGRFSVVPDHCEVDPLVDTTMDVFRALSDSKHIHLDRSVSEEALAVWADRERVLQVLSNLLGNAMKFTPPGGHVTLAVERQGKTVCFAVSDTGPGIPPEKHARIFERFWKDEEVSSTTKGSGLGLFIAKRIVDAHGGRIWVESEVDHGATFYFTLPIPGSEHAVPRAKESGGDGADPSVAEPGASKWQTS